MLCILRLTMVRFDSHLRSGRSGVHGSVIGVETSSTIIIMISAESVSREGAMFKLVVVEGGILPAGCFDLGFDNYGDWVY